MKLLDIFENDSEHYDSLKQTGFYGKEGSGCLILAKNTGRILFVHRSTYVEQPGTYSGVGGAIDKGQTPEESARREVKEEIGYNGQMEMIPLFVFKKNTFSYYNFLAIVPEEFTPILNWEADDYKWCEFGDWPKPLHFGMISLLNDENSVTKIKNSIKNNILNESLRLNDGSVVVKNPSISGLMGLLRRTDYNELRGLVFGNDVYWWDGNSAIHGYVARQLGHVNYIDNRLKLNYNRGTNKDMILFYHDDSWSVERIKNHPQLKKLLTEQIYFYDLDKREWVPGNSLIHIDEATIDNVNGWGATSYNQNVDYRGLRVKMTPSNFLKLALPLNEKEEKHLDNMKNYISNGGSIGAPFLLIEVADEWLQGDCSTPAIVYGHEGRHRMISISELEGDVPTEVHLFFRAATKEVRNRNIKQNWIDALNKEIIPEDESYPIAGPFFETKQLNEVFQYRMPKSDWEILDKSNDHLEIQFKIENDTYMFQAVKIAGRSRGPYDAFINMNVWNVDFLLYDEETDDMNMGFTNKHNSLKVFSAVYQILIYLKTHCPVKGIFFSGKEPKRQRLYDQLSKKLAANWNWKSINDVKLQNTLEKNYLICEPDVAQKIENNLTAINENRSNITSMEFKNWFGNSKVVDDNGNPLPVYHGTQRPDRVGNVFHKSRATSGPMSYFTDSPDIASNYAVSKSDTSLNDDGSYENWFLVKIPGIKTPISIDKAWWYLSSIERKTIAEKSQHVTKNDDEIIFDENHTNGIGDLSYTIKEYKNNVLKALLDRWVCSGALFGEEEEFIKVLKLSGMTTPVIYNNPDKSLPFVYSVYLSIQNPLDTSNIPHNVITELKRVAKYQPRRTDIPYSSVSFEKYNKDPIEWVTELTDPSHSKYVWVSIPDWVTRTLIKLGYDGIKDTGGKYGGNPHTVWVPFRGNQIKSIHNKLFSRSKSIIKEISGVGKIVPGINTPPGIHKDEIKRQAKKFGNNVTKDGVPPIINPNGKFRK